MEDEGNRRIQVLHMQFSFLQIWKANMSRRPLFCSLEDCHWNRYHVWLRRYHCNILCPVRKLGEEAASHPLKFIMQVLEYLANS